MTPERYQRLKQALRERQHDLTVLADGICKDHNISAIMRTCDAAGVAGIHAVSPDGKFRRHHMVAGGSKRWVRVSLHESSLEACAALRGRGLRLVAAHSGPKAIDYRKIDYTRPTAIVLGAELTGPTPETLGEAEAAVAIPMHGLVESLNVSVAAAVILFEAERQRRAAGLYARPPEDPERFARTLFEWAHPGVARRCRELGRDYPELDEEGNIAGNPFAG